MPHELINIQVGQCGNQIGNAYWRTLLKEYSHFNEQSGSQTQYTDEMSSLFYLPQSQTRDFSFEKMRARAVLVDTEEGVVNQTLKGSLSSLFEPAQIVASNSGAGNNWAEGFHRYGPEISDQVIEATRIQLECCDSPQGFFFLHSLGGGTGSGLGSYLLQDIRDEYPKITRLTMSVFPSRESDVVTSPYNATFATSKLIEHADCSFCFDNEALKNRVTADEAIAKRQPDKMISSAAPISPLTKSINEREKRPFKHMNGLVVRCLSSLTSGMRFGGELNVDLGEISTNLVPYKDLHFILPSFQFVPDRRLNASIQSTFFDSTSYLYDCQPSRECFLASSLFFRGNFSIFDINTHLSSIQKKISIPYWNENVFKLGLTNFTGFKSSDYHKRSVLGLFNNTAVCQRFDQCINDFNRLYKRKACVYLYENAGMDTHDFENMRYSVERVSETYREMKVRAQGHESEEIKIARARFKPLRR
ncbi:hypothetical protein PCE1_004395 [Barthelona sp. PCE]